MLKKTAFTFGLVIAASTGVSAQAVGADSDSHQSDEHGFSIQDRLDQWKQNRLREVDDIRDHLKADKQDLEEALKKQAKERRKSSDETAEKRQQARRKRLMICMTSWIRTSGSWKTRPEIRPKSWRKSAMS